VTARAPSPWGRADHPLAATLVVAGLYLAVLVASLARYGFDASVFVHAGD
jgi:hypothetical protein